MSDNAIFEALVAEFVERDDGFNEMISDILKEENDRAAEGDFFVASGVDDLVDTTIFQPISDEDDQLVSFPLWMPAVTDLLENAKRPVPSVFNDDGSLIFTLTKSPIMVKKPVKKAFEFSEDEVFVAPFVRTKSFATECVEFVHRLRSQTNLATISDDALVVPPEVMMDLSKGSVRDFSKDLDGVLRKPLRKKTVIADAVSVDRVRSKVDLLDDDMKLFTHFPKTGVKDNRMLQKPFTVTVGGRHTVPGTNTHDRLSRRSTARTGLSWIFSRG